jgi:hypothetical protein
METHNTMEGEAVRISELPHISSALQLLKLVNYRNITESFRPELFKL